MLQKATIFILFLCLSSAGMAQISISEARSQSIGETVTVKGIVTNGSELGSIRYLQDETGGVAAYDSKLGSVKRGDEITVTGVLKNYYNLLEISPVNSFTIHSSNNPLPAPLTIVPSQLAETNEARLVRIENVSKIGGATSFVTGSNQFTANGQQFVVYLSSGMDLIGKPIPAGTMTLTGICSQYLNTYQLLLRDSDDVESHALSINSGPEVSQITTNGFCLNWTTSLNSTSEVFYGRTPELELGHLKNQEFSTQHSLQMNGLQPADLIYVSIFSVLEDDTARTATQPYITKSLSSGKMKAYFTREVNNSPELQGDLAIKLGAAVEDTLVAYINRAKQTVDMAIYNFNLTKIPHALNQAQARGVRVRMVYDGGTTNQSLSYIPDIPKIASPQSSAYGIMHNKFVVFDAASSNPEDAIVWTGSTNFTTQQVNTDANNVIIIYDQSLAKAYTLEFEEMFGSNGPTPDASAARFGPYKLNNTPHDFIIGDKYVEAYFSPSDGTDAKIVETINSAESSIEVATMLITRTNIATALQSKYNAQVPTRLLVNSEGECGAALPILKTLGDNFKTDGDASGVMHNKYMLADRVNPASDPILLTGSHNWSLSADTKNDENTLLIHSSQLVNIYYREFASRYVTNGGTLLAVKEFDKFHAGISVFPNPTSGELTVSFEKSNPFTLRLVDISGKAVLTQTIANTNRHKIDISSLKPGVYVLTLYNETGEKASYQILKTR